ncbi:MAG: FadR/GntR family transcriptional regulator [Formivibrio sp.]|nr:FadR/GntR family transcriptional regulator [Formivibrio sp.]
MTSIRIKKTDKLAQAFGQDLARGVFKPGTALPTEAELCERYGVSRNVMREVIQTLSAKRLIDAQPYRGLYVMPRDQWNYLDADVLEWVLENGNDPTLIYSLLEVRSALEPLISRWAAQRATASDLAVMEEALNAMKANTENRTVFMEADIRLHRAIALASHNVVIQQLSDAISALQRAIFDHTYLDEEKHLVITIKEHSDLFDAIRLKDPVEAETQSLDMIERTASRARVKLDSAESV